LSHCVIDFPRRDEARVPLFQAAASLRSDEFAVAILEPLLQRQFLGSVAPSAADSEEEQIISSDNDQENESEPRNIAIKPSLKISRAREAQLAQTIGETMIRLNRLSDAASYFEVARRLEDSPELRRESRRKIADLRAALRMQQQNALRQPLLHEALEQDRTVRPRLLARAAPGPKIAAPKGGAKP
jgi:hypothetical protein